MKSGAVYPRMLAPMQRTMMVLKSWVLVIALLQNHHGLLVCTQAAFVTVVVVSCLPSAPTPAGRYVPPALRNRSQGEDAVQSEAQMKLQRQLKGLLNRCVDSL